MHLSKVVKGHHEAHGTGVTSYTASTLYAASSLIHLRTYLLTYSDKDHNTTVDFVEFCHVIFPDIDEHELLEVTLGLGLGPGLGLG